MLPGGQLVAVKRSQQVSLQGSLEFRTEIELLSRVHHKNVVTLVGFCVDQGEQTLVYEYVPNESLDKILFSPSSAHCESLPSPIVLSPSLSLFLSLSTRSQFPPVVWSIDRSISRDSRLFRAISRTKGLNLIATSFIGRD